jgi:hypothetical protein
MVPFRYDNIENHVRTQHPAKFAEYERAKKTWKYASRYEECNIFFSSTGSSATSERSPFQPGQVRQQLVFTIDKDIVEKIIGEMMYSSTNDCMDAADEDAMHYGENNDDERLDVSIASSRFCTTRELNAVIADRLVVNTRSKELALSLFEKINTRVASGHDTDGASDMDGNGGDSAYYGYVAMITKPLLFELAIRYISCGASFRMAEAAM